MNRHPGTSAAGLELEDIRWRSGTIVVRRKGGRSEAIPLPADAGQAVADYLTVRPAARDTRPAFISAYATLAAGDQERGKPAGQEPLQDSGNPGPGAPAAPDQPGQRTCWRPVPRFRRSASSSGTAAPS